MEGPVLTISILCSGRPDTTLRCLDSLAPIRKAVKTELIIVDTGCDGELRATLKKRATKVIDFTWCDDFSAARNAALKEATGQWFFYIDDDEFVINGKPLVAWLKNKYAKEMNYADCIVRNFYDEEETVYNDATVTRLARIRKSLKFKGVIHEYMTPLSDKTTAVDLLIGHTGYVNTTAKERQAKSLRNIPLLLKMMEKEPDEARWAIQLSQEYENIHDYVRMYELAATYYNKTLAFDVSEVYPVRCLFSEAMVLALLGMEKWGELESTAYNLLNYMTGGNIWQKSLMLYALALANCEAAQNSDEQGVDDSSLSRAVDYAKQYFANYIAVESNPYCYHPIDKSVFVMDIFDSAHRKLMGDVRDLEKVVLSRDIKLQLRSLINMGYSDQARIVLTQIKNLVLWDEDFDAIEKELN